MVHKYDPSYYQKNKEHIKAARKKYRADNKDKIHEQQKVWYSRKAIARQLDKIKVLTYYGNDKLACVRCGYDDVRALTIDHVVPIGGRARKCSGIQFYRSLQLWDYPRGYQTLCANCQMIKMFEGNEWKI